MKNYFSLNETSCRDNCGFDLTPDFKSDLNQFREAMGFAMALNSAARCIKHNAAVGGVATSEHTKGHAVDIKWDHLGAMDKFKMLAYAVVHFDGVGLSKVFLHVDKGGIKKVWFY